uniref:hypothetical protein n=1 Tax=Argonema antarcticum TaxID=2942763 RepID=UPI0030DD065F
LFRSCYAFVHLRTFLFLFASPTLPLSHSATLPLSPSPTLPLSHSPPLPLSSNSIVSTEEPNLDARQLIRRGID